MSVFNRYNKWQFMCVKILPLVYDDSLSYYEFLCKMNKVLTDVVEEVNEQGEAIEALQSAIESALTEDKVVQDIGDGTDVVMSQKAVTDALSEITIELEQTTGQSTTKAMSQKATTDAIDAAKTTVVQTSGQSTSSVMSQKAVSDALSGIRSVPVSTVGNAGQFLVVGDDGVPAWTTVPYANGEDF